MATQAKKRTAAAASKAASANRKEKKRLWLMYPPQKITRPILWELGRKFELITNIRQASVSRQASAGNARATCVFHVHQKTFLFVNRLHAI